jgi:hypothetical protein
MEQTPASIYYRALIEAQQELLDVQNQIQGLSKRREQLEAVIANLSPLVPQMQSPLFPIAKTSTVASPSLPQPIWKSILQSITDKANGFTVRDALQGLERTGRPIQSKNRFQIVRSALKNKTDYFTQIAPGLFVVIDRSNEKEADSEETTS